MGSLSFVVPNWVDVVKSNIVSSSQIQALIQMSKWVFRFQLESDGWNLI